MVGSGDGEKVGNKSGCKLDAAMQCLLAYLAVIGARDLSFLSCLEYGKQGITAVIRLAEAVLQAVTSAVPQILNLED
jgi:hypothetical protein